MWGGIGRNLHLTDEIKGMISAIPISTFGGGLDTLTWAGSPKGVFDVKSAYGIVMEHTNTSTFSGS